MRKTIVDLEGMPHNNEGAAGGGECTAGGGDRAVGEVGEVLYLA